MVILDFPNSEYFHASYTFPFPASYLLILLLLWQIVLNNIILIFFLEDILLCYIFIYKEFFVVHLIALLLIYSLTYSKRTQQWLKKWSYFAEERTFAA